MTSENQQPRWTRTTAGRHLAGRKTSNTRPELILRSALHSAGLRFRLHRSLAKSCNPDLVLPRHSLAIWVDGCFWHGHDHVAPVSKGPNSELWHEKIRDNRERDQKAVAIAAELGWIPRRIWECDIYQDVDRVVASLLHDCAGTDSTM